MLWPWSGILSGLACWHENEKEAFFWMVMKSPKICKNKEVILPKIAKKKHAVVCCMVVLCLFLSPRFWSARLCCFDQQFLGARLGLENNRIFPNQQFRKRQATESRIETWKLLDGWIFLQLEMAKTLKSPPLMGNSDHITNLISNARKVGFRSVGLPISKSHFSSRFLTFFQFFMTLSAKIMFFWGFYLSYISPTQQKWQIKVYVRIP